MKRSRWLILALTVVAVAGCKADVGREDMPTRLTAMFDPANGIVPMPNDLARGADGKLSTTAVVEDADGNEVVVATQPPAMKAFIEGYLNTVPGGFPQAMGLTVPFQPDPANPIDPATLAGDAVRVFDVTDPAAPVEVKPLSYGPPRELETYTDRPDLRPAVTYWQVSVTPPGPWTAGHRYVAFLTTKVRSKPPSCPEGVADCSAPVVAPMTFSFLKSKEPLVTDQGAAVIFATGNQAENDAIVGQLEQVRKALKPLLDAFDVNVEAGCTGDACCPAETATKIPRCRTALAWTFLASPANEAIFDPSTGTIPFPNEILLDPKTGLVNLPISPDEPASSQALKAGLNTLDGFSTLGSITQRFSLPLDPATLTLMTSGLDLVADPLPAIAIADITDVDPTAAEVDITPLLDPANWRGPDRIDARYEGGQLVLTPKPGHPLPPARRFLVGLLDTLRTQDDADTPIQVSPVFWLIRSKDSLLDAEGHSRMPGTLADADAAQLEQLRLAYKPLFDTLEDGLPKLPRTQVLALFTFRTLRTYDELQAIAAALPAPADATCTLVDAAASDLMKDVDHTHVGQVCDGGILKLQALLEAPDLSDPQAPRPGHFGVGADGGPGFRPIDVPFVMTVPRTPAPGMPVVLFQHGLYGEKEDLGLIANRLAQDGFVAIAIDAPFHGEHPIRVPGASSGTLFFTADPFAVRDNLREANLEHRQVASFVLQSLKTKLGVDVGTKLVYLGTSLGGILGPGTALVVPELERVALVAPAGHMIRILTETANEGFKKPLFDALAAAGMEPGSAELQQFLMSAQWALDRADPVNLALADATAAGPDRFLVVMARKDPFLPNGATQELAATLKVTEQTFPADDATGTMCHSFFLHGCDPADLATKYPGRFPDLTVQKAEAARAAAQDVVMDFLKQ